MAPIPIPIGLRFPENIAAPSPNKRASRSTTDPRVIIGIVVAVVCFVGFIGTACYIWRKRRRAKSMGLGEVEYAELDTTWAGAEITHRRVSELDGSSIAAPTYTRPSELVFPETASLLPTPGVWTPRSSHGEQILVSPEQVLQCDKRSYFGRLPIDQGPSSHAHIAPASDKNSTRPKAYDPDVRPYYVNPSEVEYHPNPVIFSHLTNFSTDPDAIALARASAPILIAQPVHDDPPPLYEMDARPPQEPVSLIDGIPHAWEPTLGSNRMFFESERESSMPLTNREVLQHRAQRGAHKETIDLDTPPVVGSSSMHTGRQTVCGITVLSRASVPRISVPYKRLAGIRGPSEVHPMKATSSSPQIKSFQESPSASSSPQSSTTPGSAKTDSSFASTAPLDPTSSSSSSATSPASATTKSPMTPSTPETCKFACPDCPEKFRTPGQLTNHFNRKHNPRYTCASCPAAFCLSADLKRHQRSVHNHQPDRTYQCTISGCTNPTKIFTRKDNFRRHVQGCQRRAEKGKGRAMMMG